MTDKSRQFLHDLLTTPSPSGFELKAGRLWGSYVADTVDDLSVDVMGNRVARVDGKGGPRVLITAHLDEIGLMVTRVDNDGFLRFRTIGGVHKETLPGQPVCVIPDRGMSDSRIPGVISFNAYGRTSKGTPEIGELFIDIGAEDRAEAVELIQPGDPAVVDLPPRYLGTDRLSARGLDNRIGAYIIAEVLRAYSADRGAATVLAAVTAMEEIGCYGAATVAYGRDFDCVLCIDTTYDTLVPGVDPDVYGAHGVGKGPVLIVGGMVSPELTRRLKVAAGDVGIAVQYEVCPNKTLTDADFLQLNQGGLPHCGIMIATRNVHTGVETLSLRDVEQTIELMVSFLCALPDKLDLRRA